MTVLHSGQLADVLQRDFAKFLVSKIEQLVAAGASVAVVDESGNAIIHKLIGIMCYTSGHRSFFSSMTQLHDRFNASSSPFTAN